MNVKVEKSRKGWTVKVLNQDANTWVTVATFVSRMEAWAYGFQLEHNL